MYLQGGLKRSVTTLRGGTLGYAEIVAVKVIHRASIYNIIGDCRMMLLYGSYLLKPIIQMLVCSKNLNKLVINLNCES